MRLDGPADLCSVNHPLTIRVSCRVVMALVGDSHPALPWLEHPHVSHVMCTGICIFRLTMISSRHVLVQEFLLDQVSKKGLLHRQDPQMRLHISLHQIITAKSTSPLQQPLTCLFGTRAANSLSRAKRPSLFLQVPKTRRNARRFQAAGELAYAGHGNGSACRLTRSTTWSNTMNSIRSDIWLNMSHEGKVISA